MTQIRLIGWLLITVLLTLAVGAMAPQQLPVTLYKLNLIALAGVAGYWLDRSLFPYARPDDWLADGLPREGCVTAFAASLLRRALIVAAAMIAVGLGA